VLLFLKTIYYRRGTARCQGYMRNKKLSLMAEERFLIRAWGMAEDDTCSLGWTYLLSEEIRKQIGIEGGRAPGRWVKVEVGKAHRW
jgi:hypothetical protein